MTQAQVAKAAHIDPAQISQIETSARENPRWETVVRICYALDASLDAVAKASGFHGPALRLVDPKRVRRCVTDLRQALDDLEGTILD